LQGGGKRMLREAFANDLPASVFARSKMGFAVPIGRWFREELSGMLRDMLFADDSFTKSNLNSDFVRKLVDEHHTGRRDHSQRLYALLMLELWWRAAKEETMWL
jgi:asparagine synthase (glutamine-hydrolysing)